MSEPPKYTLIMRGLDYDTAREVADKAAGGAIVWSEGKSYPFAEERPWELSREASGGNAPATTDTRIKLDEIVAELNQIADVLAAAGMKSLGNQVRNAAGGLCASKAASLRAALAERANAPSV